jgi:RNA 3'-terminal phosphate cyclase (ATP)
MLTIDGSNLEGGGQIVRSAVAASALSGVPVTITRIRKNRTHPGLAPQHIAAVRAVAEACGAETTGLSPGSLEVSFCPGPLRRADLHLDLKTAGSIPLVIQAWLPVALQAGGRIMVSGGTEVAWSPTIDYVDHVMAPVLRRLGASIAIEVAARGYFPQGGGRVTVQVEPARLSRITIPESEPDCGIISCSSGLPDHVAERQAVAAESLVRRTAGLSCTAIRDPRQGGASTGSSVTAWIGAKGGCALGKRGLPAEKVGRMAATALIEEYRRPGDVDLHLSDQLLIYLGEFGGAYSCHSLSMHAATVCWVLGEFGYSVECTGENPVEFSS